MVSTRTPTWRSLYWVPVAAFILLVGAPWAGADAAQEYLKLSTAVSSRNLAETVNTLASYGSRVAGYPGDARAADYVERQFREIGLDGIRVGKFPVAVPMDRGASITLGGQTRRIYPLWPNLVRTSQLPPSGLTAPLIYVRNGELSNFNGQDVEGSIVLVDFNSRAEWMNAPRLGARAVVFVAPETTMRGEAEAKFISIPISIPRFWITRADVAPLLAATSGARARLHA